MVKDCDCIIFESRSELGHVLRALEEWIQSHPHEDGSEDVRELFGLLDAMEMSW